MARKARDASLSQIKSLLKKRTKADGTLIDLWDQTITDLDVANASDRATALVLATRLEHEIERSIETHFVELDDNQRASIFEGDGPLSTLSAKVRLAYALGIFGARTKHDLDIIRSVRNVFAHTWQHVGFGSDAITTACAGLSMKGITNGLVEQPNPKQRYLDTILLIVSFVRFEREKKKPILYLSSEFRAMMD